MEASVKERLTGALILVAVLAVVVPEMLSGPRPPAQDASVSPAQSAEAGAPLRTFRMTLGESTASAPVINEAAAEAPVAKAAPTPESPPVPAEASDTVKSPEVAVATPPAPAPAPEPVAAPEKPKEAPAAAAARSNTATGKWWAQLGSFAGQGNAERLARQLRTAGFNVDVSKVKSGGKELYRVRAGPVADRAAAVELQARLAASGNKSTLVAP